MIDLATAAQSTTEPEITFMVVLTHAMAFGIGLVVQYFWGLLRKKDR